jgi:glycine/D-amino acid oxidase-like deaminating enzyme
VESLAIVGAGIVGLSCALFIAELGHKCSIVVFDPPDIEKTSLLALGVFCIKGGWVGKHKSYSNLLEGQKKLLDFLNKNELSCHKGVFEPIYDLAKAQKKLERVFGSNFFNSSNSYIRELSVLGRSQPCFYYPDDFWFSAAQYLACLKKKAKELGVVFKEDFVCSLMKKKSGYLVTTKTETNTFNKILLCSGSGTQKILENSELKISLPQMNFVKGTVIFGENEKLENCSFTEGKFNFNSNNGFYLMGPLEELPAENVWVDDILRTSSTYEKRTGIRVKVKSDYYADFFPKDSSKFKLGIATGFYKNGLFLSQMYAQELVSAFLR